MLTIKSGLDFFGIRWLWLVGLDGIQVLVAWMKSQVWFASDGIRVWFWWFSEEKADIT